MHHKRKGPKSTRAGCLMCKPHKRQGAPRKSRMRHSALKAVAAYAADGRSEASRSGNANDRWTSGFDPGVGTD